jgi:hypothetical protein
MPSFRGIRTRVLLIAALIAVTTTVTGGSLLIIRSRIHQHVSQELADDLTHSLGTLQNLQQQRRDALIHESALLADLSDLKALMTTHDQRTIQDGATLFWKDSGSDLQTRPAASLPCIRKASLLPPLSNRNCSRRWGSRGSIT